MRDGCSRRAVLASLPVVAVAGCLSSAGGTPDGGDRTGTETATATPTDTPTPTREELVERLPEPSPLAGSLTDLVAAADREATAEEYDLDYRPDDGTVRVVVELESGAELPNGYRVEVVDQYQNQVTAYVHVNDLVGLATHDGVRKVREPAESETHGTPF